jgi:hypothetical protein
MRRHWRGGLLLQAENFHSVVVDVVSNTNATDITDTLGSRYEGDFKENVSYGFGKYVLPNASICNGMWREGMMNGCGVFMWPDHSVYDDGKRYVQK